ncbi:MDR family MFS transporter [Paenarthrobacter sp. PH39-S1]|uniref:MDR family MFS transporter n=1 Tax=Paenarthrobacter sp. PH39-S1 TaxID=3046204 RepID=UPI0024BAABE8|nr:MDR family MFS transporter [Paenarthrobacter sp. PH39-S1]MDJ0356744.1 MDR family MFS transporter [Paenarthrobacter sp. PH39-S1]
MNHRQILEALTGLLAALFTAILSSTIVANALPTIMSELHGSQTDFAWVITAALLANAATTPIWGKLSDLFDKKLLVQLSIIIFVAGSVLAGLSETIPLLLTARVIQGVAMGGLTALAQSIIGTIIPPRERGRYSGYMGAVMAVATAGGPLLGGFIVDSPLGWRWTFYVCVPLAIIALILLQKTLKLQHIKRKVKIDYVGSILLTAGVSLLLIWVSFAGQAGYYDWISWQSGVMVGASVVMLALLVLVESKVAQPIIPLKIIAQRTPALAIIASIAVGVAMFASSSYLGQYYQVSRGATPTEAGLLTMPMIAGNLIGSVVAGLLVSTFGKWKGYLVGGAVLLIVGLGLAGTIDHSTSLFLVGVYTFVFGLGLGMMMQNLVLAVQNTVAAKDIGAASGSVAFFRTVGGAAGVSVLGAILGTRVTDLVSTGLKNIGVTGAGSGVSLDVKDLPAPIAEVVRAAYGDGTALIFTIAAFMSVVALIAVLLIKEVPLRRTVDIVPISKTAGGGDTVSADAMAVSSTADGAGVTGAQTDDGGGPAEEPGRAFRTPSDLDREFADVLSEGVGRTAERHQRYGHEAGIVQPQKHSAAPPSAAAQLAEAEAQLELAAQIQVTQRLLAEQQLQLSSALTAVGEQSARLRGIAGQQAATAARLTELEAQLAKERELQKAAARYLAEQHGALDRAKAGQAGM